jgi:nitrate reductase gamma subunit
LRFFLQPAPHLIGAMERLDGILQVGLPHIYISDAVFVSALAYLIARRLHDPVLRFVSLFSDHFVLFLLAGIALSGLLLRYAIRVDLVAVKQFALSLAALHPRAGAPASPIFLIHFILVSTLAAYFPLSKLMHMAGAFLSPTRNLPNNSRAQRHINPWNAPVVTHSYEEWEQEFRGKLEAAAIPIEAQDAGRTTAD